MLQNCNTVNKLLTHTTANIKNKLTSSSLYHCYKSIRNKQTTTQNLQTHFPTNQTFKEKKQQKQNKAKRKKKKKSKNRINNTEKKTKINYTTFSIKKQTKKLESKEEKKSKTGPNNPK